MDLKRNTHQLGRYTVAAGIAAIVDILTFSIFSPVLGIDYRIALVMSFGCGGLVNFLFCYFFVFPEHVSEKSVWKLLLKHYGAGLFGLGVNQVCLITMVELLQFEQLVIAKIIATGIAFVCNFLTKKLFVYNSPRASQA